MTTLMEKSEKTLRSIVYPKILLFFLPLSATFCHLLCRQWVVQSIGDHPWLLAIRLSRDKYWGLNSVASERIKTLFHWAVRERGELRTCCALQWPWFDLSLSHILLAFPECLLQLSVGCRYCCGTWKALEIRYAGLLWLPLIFLLTWER